VKQTGTSPRFDIKKGVKQGWPISPSLFILATEMLALLIKNSSIEKWNVFGHEIILSHLADDTTLFLKGLDQVPKVIGIVNYFSKFSGLNVKLLPYMNALLKLHIIFWLSRLSNIYLE